MTSSYGVLLESANLSNSYYYTPMISISTSPFFYAAIDFLFYISSLIYFLYSSLSYTFFYFSSSIFIYLLTAIYLYFYSLCLFNSLFLFISISILYFLSSSSSYLFCCWDWQTCFTFSRSSFILFRFLFYCLNTCGNFYP